MDQRRLVREPSGSMRAHVKAACLTLVLCLAAALVALALDLGTWGTVALGCATGLLATSVPSLFRRYVRPLGRDGDGPSLPADW